MDYDTLMERVWTNGSYDRLANDYRSIAARVVEAADVGPGDTVLDVGCGTGSVAVTAARRGATVTGVDLAPDLLGVATENAEIARVPGIEWREADAADLPFEDETFDVTLSSLGHMYADPPAAATTELCRVTRPEGRIAYAAWTPTSLFPFMASVAATYVDAADMPEIPNPPFMWGDADVAADRLEDGVTDLAFESRTTKVQTLSPVHFWEAQREHSGIFSELLERVPAAERRDFAAEMVETVETYFDEETNAVELEYLLASGRVV